MAHIYMILAAVSWSFFPMLSALLLDEMNPFFILLVMQIYAFLCCALCGIFWKFKIKDVFHDMRICWKDMGTQQWLAIATSGICSVISSLMFYFSLYFISNSGATILFESWPIIAMVLIPYIVTRDWQPNNSKDYIFGIIATIGMVIIIMGDYMRGEVKSDQTSFFIGSEWDVVIGYALAIGSSYVVAISNTMRAETASYFMAAGGLWRRTFLSEATIRLFALAAIVLIYMIMHDVYGLRPQIDVDSALILFLLSLCIIVTNIFYTIGLNKTTHASINILWYLMPLMAVLLMWIVGKAELNMMIIGGGLLVIGANVMIYLFSHKADKNAVSDA